MRTLSNIQSVWESGGPFVGTRKPVTRVTVQQGWSDSSSDLVLNETRFGLGSSSSRGNPMRWYQNQANNQIEKELPNVLNVSIDRSVDQDAASFNIELINQWMYTDGAAPTQLTTGQPGYFTPDRGEAPEARAKWGHFLNEWNGLLVPNAVIRVYTGFGGATGPISTAVTNGNLALYGVFLVDDIRISTGGRISITGRDMAKLLIDQQLFPPLVPSNKYPLTYQRWKFHNFNVHTAPKTVTTNATTTGITAGEKKCTYSDSSQDRWYGANASIHGHRGSDSIDGNIHSYALSVGNSGPNRDFSTVWWEYWCGENMNAVHVYPWAGNYEMYVSIHDGTQWLGDNSVPYSAAHILATQSPAVDTGAAVRYVAKYTVPHETARDYVLPTVYNAVKVRISFRNLYDSGIGPWKYRAGVREFKILGIQSTSSEGSSTVTTGTSATYTPFVMAGGSRILETKSYSQGYGTVSNFDQIDVFGDAKRYSATTYEGITFAMPTAMLFTKSGDGYWILGAGGRIRAHGSAAWHGDPKTDGFLRTDNGGEHCWDMAMTHTGHGYWVLTTLGRVFAYGDAAYFGPHHRTGTTLCSSIAAHPNAMGYWVLDTRGQVRGYGAATSYGGFGSAGSGTSVLYSVNTGSFANANESAQCIRSNSTGDGYWILTSKGRVLACGAAKHMGEPSQLADHSKNSFTEAYWELMPAPLDEGYWLLHASGRIEQFGNIEFFGMPVPGTQATRRYDGNYLDYTDIARDLALWSGFLFYDPDHPSNEPAPVYGSLESTGAFSKEPLPDDVFDKRPVIDALTQIREVVGYLCWVDAEGRFRWESPNFWKVGNFNENGQHVQVLPTIDERVQMTGYTLSTADAPVRSSIIISSHDPYADYSGTITTNYKPPSRGMLRGIVKPAMWVNDFFVNPTEQRLMAELIGLHISFQERIGQVECVASPHIEINDQVRIYERETAEVYVHYVRGIGFNHDLVGGDYKMTLTTHWLATGTGSGDIIGSEEFPASSLLAQRIAEGQFAKQEITNYRSL